MSHFEYQTRVLASLSTFVLTDANIERFRQGYVKPCAPPRKIPKKQPVVPDTHYTPTGTVDTLFWCFYIVRHSVSQFEMNQNHLFQLEKQEKFELLEKLRQQGKEFIKLHKLKQSDVESNLCNEQQTSLATFKALCILEKINAILVHNRFYMEFVGDPADTKVHVLHLTRKKYAVELAVTDASAGHYRNELFLVENPAKPLRAISSYKLQDLRDMATKLELDLPGKANKRAIYNEIVSYIEHNLF
jgi:hypothetical protein